jgi:maleylpyruvate isomerase
MPAMSPGVSVALAACRAAHERLLVTASRLDDATVRQASRLPGWSIGHVLTHLARNAEGHARRLEGALLGEEVARYPGGSEQRAAEIEDGSGRPAAELLADITGSAQRLEDVWDRSEEMGWPNATLLADDDWPTFASPRRRLREVEVHHVDLGVGYEPTDWPDDFVARELARALENLPGRLTGPTDAPRLLAWLLGRSAWPDPELSPW